jgi:tryptophan-rich sensory protein
MPKKFSFKSLKKKDGKTSSHKRDHKKLTKSDDDDNDDNKNHDDDSDVERDELAWYILYKKRTCIPTHTIFPIAWSILYLLIAATTLIFWWYSSNEKDNQFENYDLGLLFLLINHVLNTAWTPIFFGSKGKPVWIFIALLVILLMVGTGVGFIVIAGLLGAWAPFIMYLIYVLWTVYAMGLNLVFFRQACKHYKNYKSGKY